MNNTNADFRVQVDLMIKRAENGKIAYAELEKIFKEGNFKEEEKQIIEYIASRNIVISFEDEAEEKEEKDADGEEEKEENKSDGVRSALEDYMRQIGEYPSLSREREIELGRRIRQGDKEAREELINSNLKLVVSIAKRFKWQADMMDLIGYGNEGLIEAVEKFDPERGNRFSTMAVWWIRKEISRNVSNVEDTIRIPVHMKEKISKVKKMEQTILREDGYIASEETLAERLGYTMEDMRKIRAVMGQLVSSLDQKIGDDDGAVLELLIENPTSVNPEIIIEKNALYTEINQAFACLTSREKKVIEMRFGLQGRKTCTLDEVGKRMELTRERIRQIETTALCKLYEQILAARQKN